MGQKKNDTDAAAEFFGDSDVDWLKEEEDGGATERMPVAPAVQTKPVPIRPIAPPPPPPPSVTRTATPIDGSPAQEGKGNDGWTSKISEVPENQRALSTAPTLIFSSVPTGPPSPSPLSRESPLSVDASPGRSPQQPLSEESHTSERPPHTPTVVMQALPPIAPRVAPPPKPAPPAGKPVIQLPPESPPDEVLTQQMQRLVPVEPPPRPNPPPPQIPSPQIPPPAQSEVIVEPTREEAPPPRSHAPLPGRVTVTTTPPPQPVRATAPQAPVSYTPTSGESTWKEAIATLEEEAQMAMGPGRAALYHTAGRIALGRLSDPVWAERLLTASAYAHKSIEAGRLLAEARALQSRYTEQEQALLDVARLSVGLDRTEAYLQAALIAAGRRDRPAEAVAYLKEAAVSCPEDYPSRVTLLELLTSTRSPLEERLALLDEVAQLAEGGIASDARMTQATLAQEAGRPDEVRRALELALEAEPGHMGAFQRLERAIGDDPLALAQLYDREAMRPGQSDQGWWKGKAARAWLAAGRGEAAVEAFTAAVEAGYPFAQRELQGAYQRTGAFRELEGLLAQEAYALTEEEGRAFALFRLGWMRELHLADIEGALAAYRDAVELDPAASPAADAVVRLLSDEERTAFIEDRIQREIDPDECRALQLWLAEQAEAQGDYPHARQLFEALSTGQGAEAEIARDGLDRVLQRMNDAGALSQMRRARADASADTNDRVAWLLLAGSMPADRTHALPMWSSALDARPDHPVALAAVSVALELEKRWTELSNRLRAAGEAAPDAARKASYLYRAARVLSEYGHDRNAAIACVEKSLKAEPRLRPARWLARNLHPVRDASVEAGLYRDQALHAVDLPGRTWARFAAAVLRGFGPDARSDLDAILVDRPDHPGALAVFEILLVAERDRHGLVGLFRRAIGAGNEQATSVLGARLAARTAELLVEVDRREEAILVLRRLRGVRDAPIGPAALLLLAAGAPEKAIELLADSNLEEHRAERARLWVELGRGVDALPLLLELATKGSGSADRIGAAARAGNVAKSINDPGALLLAYSTIAREAKSPALRAAYGTWAAASLQAASRYAEALDHWGIVLSLRPSTGALLQAVSALVARKESEKIWRLFADVQPDAGPMLADALLQAGDPSGAADVLTSHADSLARQDGLPEARLAALLEVERGRAELQDWQHSYDALTQRRDLCKSGSVRATADAARRWVLAEKLASTDAAWELHLKLHEDAPEDRQVTAALARIAGARGEVGKAIGWLKELAESAPSREEAAKLRCKMGEVYEGAGQMDGARQAYLDALDDLPGDAGALEGLRRLAEQAKDWPGLVSVLAREASSAKKDRQIELLRQIAMVTEDRMGDLQVAVDRWRAALELDPTDRISLERLLHLAEVQEDWIVFVETAEQLSGQLSGKERAALLRRIGIACQDKLGRDDAARWYEQAVSGTPPDYEAAARLEGLARVRADWPAAVRALRLQASAHVDPSQRLEALLKAARIELEALHDKEAAAGCYRQVLELDRNHEGALRFMASHLFDARRFDEALPICQRLEPLLQNQAGTIDDLDDFDTRIELSSFYFSFAEMLRNKGDDEQALPRYEAALALNATHLPVLEAIGPLYVASGQWNMASDVYRQLIQLSGGQGEKAKVASNYTSLGLVERELGSPDKAAKRFTKALELHPNHVGALKGMALILEDRSDWSNLLNVYNNIIYHATVPEDVIDAYMTKGRILDDQMQRQDKAAQHYQRSLDFDPNQPNAHLRLAELAMRRDAYKEAGDLADKALQLDADLVQKLRPLLLIVRSACWQDAGRGPEAERCLREARMLDTSLAASLGDNALQDLERMRRAVKERLPK